MPAFRGPAQIKTVAVVGAGLIGSGWAAAFLSQGLAVRVSDPSPGAEAQVRAQVAEAWPLLLALGVAPNAAQDRISFHASVEEAVREADFVQENAPERAELKVDLYRRLDAAAAPDVLLASSTSSFPITELQAACAHPERCVLGHPFNPVHLIPLVEVGGGAATAPEAIQAAMAFYRRLQKRPIELKDEIFGHVANRLASAMFREAVHLVAEGVVTVEGIDDALRFGPALKWAIQGQFMTYFTSGGPGGMADFLEKFGPGQERRWAILGAPSLTPELKAKIVAQTDAVVAGRSPQTVAAAQDEALVAVIRALRS
jgi:carnitine 3-dehydrogenase